MNVCVMASGRGSNLKSLIKSQKSKKFTSKIALVISNNSNSGALEIARNNGIPALHISGKLFDSNDAFEKQILSVLRKFRIDLIVLAGYMKLLGNSIIRNFKNKIINVHPSLLPAFSGTGIFGTRVHEEVLKYGCKITGATVHIVNKEYDKGPVLLQKAVLIKSNETPESLQKKVLKVENQLLEDAINLYEKNKINVSHGKVSIF